MTLCFFRGNKSGGDLLEPLISVSCSKDQSSNPSESDSSIVVQRDPSKLGLFSLVGLSIVLTQVNMHDKLCPNFIRLKIYSKHDL